jgi:hypothetical protein
MASAPVMMLDGKPAALINDCKPNDKLLLIAWLPRRDPPYAEGESVEYALRWGGGWEGEAALIGGETVPLELVYNGRGRTIPDVAEDLGLDEDQLGLTGL